MNPTEQAPQRVLLVSHYYPPHLGGIEGVARQEAERLTAAGARVTVLTSGPRSSTVEEDGVTVVRVAAWNGFERHGIPFPVPLPSLFRRARHWARWADVVHVHDTFYLTSWAGWFGSASTGTPMVVTQHIAMAEHPQPVVGLIQRLVYALVGKRLIRRARTVFTMNERVAQFARELGADPSAIRHLPNGVDTEAYRPARDERERAALRAGLGLPADGVLILFAGRLLPKKGFGLLLEAADPAYRLVFAGSGDARALERREDVHYLGALPAARMAEAFRACDVFALPTTVNEGFPLVVQEAMSSGLPVVTTDDPGYAPYALDRDLVALIPRDADVLHTHLRKLALDPGLRAAMGDYSRAHAERNPAWAAHVATLLECYRAAAEARPPTARRAPR